MMFKLVCSYAWPSTLLVWANVLMLQFEVQKAYTTQDAQKGRPARPQRLKKVEVEVKVEQRSDSFHLHLNLSL